MNDKDYLEDYLLILKSTIEVYIHGTLESSNSDVREELLNALEETIKHQSSTYEELTDKGFYEINNVSSTLIDETIKKLEKAN